MSMTEMTIIEAEEISGGMLPPEWIEPPVQPEVDPEDYWLHRWPIFPPRITPSPINPNLLM